MRLTSEQKQQLKALPGFVCLTAQGALVDVGGRVYEVKECTYALALETLRGIAQGCGK